MLLSSHGWILQPRSSTAWRSWARLGVELGGGGVVAQLRIGGHEAETEQAEQ